MAVLFLDLFPKKIKLLGNDNINNSLFTWSDFRHLKEEMQKNLENIMTCKTSQGEDTLISQGLIGVL